MKQKHRAYIGGLAGVCGLAAFCFVVGALYCRLPILCLPTIICFVLAYRLDKIAPPPELR